MEYKDSYKLSKYLFKNLLYFCEKYNKTISETTLLDGFPIKHDKNLPNLLEDLNGNPLFVTMAKKVGFKSKLINIKLKNISNLMLPCIAILNDDSTVIIDEIDNQHNTLKVKVVYDDEFTNEVSFEEFEKLFSNKLFLIKKDFVESVNKKNILDNNEGHWFFGVIKSNLKIYKDVIIASLAINIFVLFTPFYIMNIYDRVVPNFATETLWALSIGILVVYLFDISLKTIRAYYIDIVSKKIDIVVSSRIYEKILNMKLSAKPNYTGAFANNIKDFEQVKNFFSSSTVAVLVDLPFTAIFLVAIAYISGSIVLIPIIFILLLLVYSFFIKKPLHNSIEASNEAISLKNGILIESLNALETIKSLGASGHLRWKWEESTADISKKSMLTKLLSNSITNVNSLLIQSATVFVVIVGVYQISENNLTLGGLIAAVILSSRAIAPMGQFASLISNYEQAKASYNMLDNIMKLPEEREKNKAAIHKEKINGNFKVSNLTFNYDENKKVLDNISLEIKHGEKVAIIGKMGSGKSTILKLFMKLFDEYEGEIIADGIELKQIENADVRKNFAYVSQDSILFNGTLKENILYKYPNASDEVLVKATKKAQLLDFVNSHPLGFDMQVGERGDTLSGGQKKAVSIARSLVGEYSTLLLDEPTDSMDSRTELNLIKDLKEEIKDKTVILITHKNTMLELVDRVIVMDNGKILLDGKKEDVLNTLIGKKNEK